MSFMVRDDIFRLAKVSEDVLKQGFCGFHGVVSVQLPFTVQYLQCTYLESTD